MLRWQDLLRPFAENLEGVRPGSLTRWFNNNTFCLKPHITSNLRNVTSVTEGVSYTKHLPKNKPWKAILPTPYTLAHLSENKFYKDKTELMFKYTETLRTEIENLARHGISCVQLGDSALVYRPDGVTISKDDLRLTGEALTAWWQASK
jgi:methionine synthase II (cobalamin-independent)